MTALLCAYDNYEYASPSYTDIVTAEATTHGFEEHLYVEPTHVSRGDVEGVLRTCPAASTAVGKITKALAQEFGTKISLAVEVTDFSEKTLIVLVSGEPYDTLLAKLDGFIETTWAGLTEDERKHVGVWVEEV